MMTPVGLPGSIILSGRTSQSALSYIEVDGTSLQTAEFTFMAWIFLSGFENNMTLLDSRQFESSKNLYLEINSIGQLNVTTPDGQSFLTPSSNPITTKTWHFVAFTFSTFDGKGGFMVDEKFGFENASSNEIQKGNYFFYDSNSWMPESTKYPIRIGGNKFNFSKNFAGQISCIQILDKMLSPAQIYDYMNCSVLNNYKQNKCPEGYLLMDGLCYIVKDKPRKFHDAEVRCLPPPGHDGIWTQGLAGQSHSYFLEKLLKLAESFTGSMIDMWVGIEDRNSDDHWRDASGKTVVFSNDSIWHGTHSSKTKCAYISSTKPGYLQMGKCSEEKPYACVRPTLDMPSDNSCPLGYIPSKKKCLMSIPDLHNYTKAKEECALHGGHLFTPTDEGELSFMKGFAHLNSKAFHYP